jgi:hypothetical protein
MLGTFDITFSYSDFNGLCVDSGNEICKLCKVCCLYSVEDENCGLSGCYTV